MLAAWLHRLSWGFLWPTLLSGLLHAYVSTGMNEPAPVSVHYTMQATLPSDTLRFAVTAGEVLIFNLPHPATSEEGYTPLHLPAFSDLSDTAFFWRTQPSDVGQHQLLFAKTLRAEAVDSLYVIVTVDAEH